MTREERIKLIKHLKYNRSIGADYLITDKDADEIIKALEQESMREFTEEEAKSYSKALDKMYKPTGFNVFDEYGNYKYPGDVELVEPNTVTSMPCVEGIHALPPVTPQPKTGYWIRELIRNEKGEDQMTDYQEYINALRKCAKEHDNDRTSMGHIIVSKLCRDTADLLEDCNNTDRINYVLDKIRADIEGYKSTIDNAISEDELKIEGMKEAYTDCLETIDKYKTENTLKENKDNE